MSDKIISKKEVEKVATLARIHLEEKEKELFSLQLNEILEHFKNLANVDTASIRALNHYGEAKSQLRDDLVDEIMTDEKDSIRKQFPRRYGNYLEVEAVLNS